MGANVCSVIRYDKMIYILYWLNSKYNCTYKKFYWIVVFEDNGKTFNRLFDGSILDRNNFEPYYTRGAVDVVFDAFFKTWYTSGTIWKITMVNLKFHITSNMQSQLMGSTAEK
jgi:hypothetical protein